MQTIYQCHCYYRTIEYGNIENVDIVGLLLTIAVGGVFGMLDVWRRSKQKKMNKISIYNSCKKIGDIFEDIAIDSKNIDVGDDDLTLVHDYLRKKYGVLQLLYEETRNDLQYIAKENDEYTDTVKSLLECTKWLITEYFIEKEEHEVLLENMLKQHEFFKEKLTLVRNNFDIIKQ